MKFFMTIFFLLNLLILPLSCNRDNQMDDQDIQEEQIDPTHEMDPQHTDEYDMDPVDIDFDLDQ